MRNTRKLLRYLLPALLVVATSAHAIIIRSGVADSKYIVSENAFPALVDLPMEGHGTLIAKRWVVTAAHATQMMRSMANHDYVTIAGKRRKVARIILYPDYLATKMKWDNLMKRMTSKEDAATWMTQYHSILGSMHDIALIELAKPVEDVKPVNLYRGSDEQGRVAELYGKGATGDSATGTKPDAPHRGLLRHAYNRISSAHGQWLDYKFDCGDKALPLEGVIGGGDSGGPVLVRHHGNWELAGLAHGLVGSKEDLAKTRSGNFRMGVCGQEFTNTRISFYAHWIDSAIAAPAHMPK